MSLRPGQGLYPVGHPARTQEIIVTSTQAKAGTPGPGQYAPVNGINLYVETHGTGRPLILLHGGLV